MQLALVELESTPLAHSGKLSSKTAQKTQQTDNFLQNMWLLEAICERNLCEKAGHVKKPFEMIAVEFEPMQLAL